MQVNLRRDRGVPEQVGDHIDTGPGINNVAAERVSQLVGFRPTLQRQRDDAARGSNRTSKIFDGHPRPTRHRRVLTPLP